MAVIFLKNIIKYLIMQVIHMNILILKVTKLILYRLYLHVILPKVEKHGNTIDDC